MKYPNECSPGLSPDSQSGSHGQPNSTNTMTPKAAGATRRAPPAHHATCWEATVTSTMALAGPSPPALHPAAFKRCNPRG